VRARADFLNSLGAVADKPGSRQRLGLLARRQQVEVDGVIRSLASVLRVCPREVAAVPFAERLIEVAPVALGRVLQFAGLGIDVADNFGKILRDRVVVPAKGQFPIGMCIRPFFVGYRFTCDWVVLLNLYGTDVNLALRAGALLHIGGVNMDARRHLIGGAPVYVDGVDAHQDAVLPFADPGGRIRAGVAHQQQNAASTEKHRGNGQHHRTGRKFYCVNHRCSSASVVPMHS